MRILLVEDEGHAAAYLRRGLMQSGFCVDVAPGGRACLSLVRRSAYDLIVLDALSGDGSGWSLVSDLRRAGKQTPVLLMAPPEYARHSPAPSGPAMDCSSKPFAFSELLSGVRRTLRRQGGGGTERLLVGDLSVDWEALRADRAGRRLDLTPKEFLLLSLLARHAGHVLSRAFIADQVWGINFDSKTNVVDVHVRRLRAKVDDPFPEKLIYTVRGMGYLLEDRSKQAVVPAAPRAECA